MQRDEHQWWDETKDARGFHRVPAQAPATLLSTALGRVAAMVMNLSQSGCRIRTCARCHRGDHFVLKFDAIGPRAVTVVWHDGDEVGLVFDELLSWAVVTGIARHGREPIEARAAGND